MRHKQGGDTYPEHSARYEIIVSGKLHRDWASWFSGMEVHPIELDQGCFGTRLFGPVADQAALRGIVNKIWDLNLTIISIKSMGTLDREQV